MAGLQISQQQASALAGELVARHARTLSHGVDTRMAHSGAASAENVPAPAARLEALHAVMRQDLMAKAGTAARFLVVDLDLCAQQLLSALDVGWPYRENAAAGHLSAAAALGLRWLGDERLCLQADPLQDPASEAGPTEPLPEPTEPHTLFAWANTPWSARFSLAAHRAEALWVPVRYALDHAMGQARTDPITPEALRALADAVFTAEQVEHLTRFMREERALLAQAGLDGASLGDRRVESLCIAGDLAFGLGRCVRLARAAATGGAGGSPEHLAIHLREALHALAETADV